MSRGASIVIAMNRVLGESSLIISSRGVRKRFYYSETRPVGIYSRIINKDFELDNSWKKILIN